jgi:hypothetical protein
MRIAIPGLPQRETTIVVRLHVQGVCKRFDSQYESQPAAIDRSSVSDAIVLRAFERRRISSRIASGARAHLRAVRRIIEALRAVTRVVICPGFAPYTLGAA